MRAALLPRLLGALWALCQPDPPALTAPRRTQQARSRALAGLLAALAWAGCGAAWAQGPTVLRSERALAQATTQLTPASTPPTALQPQGTGGGLVPRAPATQLQPQAGPSTVLRAAEIPPGRLERTQALLVELRAQATPEQAIAIDLPADVLFDFDKAELRPDAAAPLAKAADLIQSYPRAPLRVVGHTDAKGTHAYNDALSERRAQAVARALQQHTGRSAATEGQGKRNPVAANTAPDGRDDPEGRQRNRRVQILIGALPRN